MKITEEKIQVWDGKRNITKLVCICDCDKSFLVTPHDIIRKDLNKRITSCGCSRYKSGDLTGQHFGKLTAIKLISVPGKTAKWECLCDCGNTINKIPYDLLRGLPENKSCGCLRAPNLLGKTFGRLTIIGEKQKQSDGSYMWPVSCSCGSDKQQLVYSFSLRAGKIKSCGCLSKEATQKYFQQVRIARGLDPDIKLSPIHRQLRAKIRPGKSIQKAVSQRDNSQCQLCGFKEALNLHHIIPLNVDISKALDINNLTYLCKTCHSQCAHPHGGQSYDLIIADFLTMRIKNKLSLYTSL